VTTSPDPLSLLAIRHGTDKYDDHLYTPEYHWLFGHLRDRELRLLEIGVGGYDQPQCGGQGLRLWVEDGPFDIVIDDGSHRMADVLATLRHLYPRMPADGIYVVEDTQAAFWDEFGGTAPGDVGIPGRPAPVDAGDRLRV
jgi:hypothetical protein